MQTMASYEPFASSPLSTAHPNFSSVESSRPQRLWLSWGLAKFPFLVQHWAIAVPSFLCLLPWRSSLRTSPVGQKRILAQVILPQAKRSSHGCIFPSLLPQADQMLPQMEMAAVARSSFGTVSLHRSHPGASARPPLHHMKWDTTKATISSLISVNTQPGVQSWQVPHWLREASNNRVCLKTLGSFLFQSPCLEDLIF